jgi:molybdate transport system permease protein
MVLAQFTVAAARGAECGDVRPDGPREQVALTLGCTRSRAFDGTSEARGILAAATSGWHERLGVRPILVFSGTTRLRTEVPTSVFLELTVSNLEAAVAVSLIMVAAGGGARSCVFGLRFDRG